MWGTFLFSLFFNNTTATSIDGDDDVVVVLFRSIRQGAQASGRRLKNMVRCLALTIPTREHTSVTCTPFRSYANIVASEGRTLH